MAVASWLLGGRSLRSRRNNQSRKNNGDYVQMDFYKDPSENMYEILSNVMKSEGITEGRKLSYLNAFVTLVTKSDINYDDFGYSAEEILYCLRPLSFDESNQLKNASFRAVRHFIKTEEHVDLYIKLKYDFLVARQITAAGIQLCRRVLVVCPEKFTYAPVQAMVALTHPNHSDNLQAVALAFLAELAMLNADVFVACGGVNAIVRNLPYLKPRMTEALLAPLLYLINKPETRQKAGINLHCLTDPVYMDKTLNNTTGSEGGILRLSTTALVCLLRAWPGLLHLSPGGARAISSIVNTLYIPHLQRPMLAAMYEVFGLCTPDWTDEMRVALDGVDPSRWQPTFSLNEGFVAAEVLTTHPHLAKARVNLVEVHLALVLRTLLEARLLDAIVHIIVSDDTFLSVHATILLGEILRLVHNWLPVEVTRLLPGLPNLISYAIRGRPVSSRSSPPSSPSETSFFADENLRNGLEEIDTWRVGPGEPWPMATLVDLYSRRFSLDAQDRLNGGCLEKQSRAQGAVTALDYMDMLKRNQITPSLYVVELNSTILPPPTTMLSGLIDESIKDSGVLTLKDPLTWDWDTVQAVLKNGGDNLRKSADSNKRSFLRRLVNFYLPGVGRFSHLPISADKKTTSKLSLAALDLVSLLVPSHEDSESGKLVAELLSSIKSCLVEILSSKSAHDCFISPHTCSNTHSRDYFLLIGRFGKTLQGRTALQNANIYSVLTDLIMSTNHDCYIKLILSTFDYSTDENARKILSTALESKSISGRMYATRMLHSLLRMGVTGSLMSFIIYLVVIQLEDEDKGIASYAMNILHEACESKAYVEALVELSPSLLRLGDQGLLLLVRCLSTEKGFRVHQQANFVTNQLNKWANHFNYRYVSLVESVVNEAMTNNSGGGGRWQDGGGPWAPATREAYLAPHLYQQLASHEKGLALVLNHPSVPHLVQIVAERKCSNDSEILSLKAALYSLSGIAVYLDTSLIYNIILLATHCEVYSIRNVAYVALNNIATSAKGVEILNSFGWWSVKHDRHQKWPLVSGSSGNREENTPKDDTSDTSSELNKSSSDRVLDDTILEDDSDEFYWGIPGGRTELIRERRSATLPSSSQPFQHYRSSLSESRVDSDISENKSDRMDWSGRNTRSNSCTDSSATGDSRRKFRHQSFSLGERRQTLSPIQSVGSLTTLRSTQHQSDITKIIHSTLKRSDESILKSLPQANPYPEGLITYGDLIRINSGTPSRLEVSSLDPEDADFSTIDVPDKDQSDSPSASDSRNTPDESGEDPCKSTYMGIAMPDKLLILFPREDRLYMNNHVAFMANNLHSQGLEDLKNPMFHREICFLGSRGVHNTMVSTSESEGHYMMDGEDIDLEKEPLQDGESNDSSINDVQNLIDHPMPIIFKSRVVIRSEISHMVEQLSNPLLHKACKQSLLQIKQAHNELFEDVCVLSDVLYILSRCHVRIASREFLHELFDSNCPQIWSDARAFLEEVNLKKGFDILHAK